MPAIKMLSLVSDAGAVKNILVVSNCTGFSKPLKGGLNFSPPKRVLTFPGITGSCCRRRNSPIYISHHRPDRWGFEAPVLHFKVRRKSLNVLAEQSGDHAASHDAAGKAAAESLQADRKAEELREKLGLGSATRAAGVSLSSFRLLLPYVAVACLVVAFRRTVLAELLNLVQMAFSATLSVLDFAAVLVQLAWAPLAAALAPTKAGPFAERLAHVASQVPFAIAAAAWFSVDAAPVVTIFGNMAAAWAAVSLIKILDQTDPWLPGIDIAGAAGLAAGLFLVPWPVMIVAFAAVGLYSHLALSRNLLASATPALLTLLCVCTVPVKALLLASLLASALRVHGLRGTWAQLLVGATPPPITSNGKESPGGGIRNGTLAQTAWLIKGSWIARAFALMAITAIIGRGLMGITADPVM